MGPSDKNAAESRRKELVQRAIALAMRSRWSDAVETNLQILEVDPADTEALNRLGKAFTEMGRIDDARETFHKALEVSPHNPIARKNLDRLSRLGNEAAGTVAKSASRPNVFVEDSGKSGVAGLVNLAASQVLLKLAPGQKLTLAVEGKALKVTDPSEASYVGQVEPKMASRLIRLLDGGNRYEAAVTSVGERELTILIRESYRHPSQVGVVSFPATSGSGQKVYVPPTILGYEIGEDDTDDVERVAVKDWSDDDTEPGDDEAFSPVLHRIISAGGGGDDEARQREEEY